MCVDDLIGITDDTAHIVDVEPVQRAEQRDKRRNIALKSEPRQMQERHQAGIDEYHGKMQFDGQHGGKEAAETGSDDQADVLVSGDVTQFIEDAVRRFGIVVDRGRDDVIAAVCLQCGIGGVMGCAIIAVDVEDGQKNAPFCPAKGCSHFILGSS